MLCALNSHPRITVTAVLIALSFGGALAGCGDAGVKGPKPYPAEGSVSVNGDTPVDAIVTLHPMDKSVTIRPNGQVDDEGRFKLTSHVLGDGAPVGDYKVTVVWFKEQVASAAPAAVGPITSMSGGAAESKTQPMDRLRGRYADPETSGLKCIISAEPNEIPEFKLESQK